MGRRKNKNVEVMEWSDEVIVTEKEYLNYNNSNTLHISRQSNTEFNNNKVELGNTKFKKKSKSCKPNINSIGIKNNQSNIKHKNNLVIKSNNNLFKDSTHSTGVTLKKQYSLKDKQINNYAFIYNYSNKIYNYMPIEDIEIIEEIELSDYDDDLNYE